NISVIVDGTEVVGNQNGVPFNPTIYWLGTSIPTLPEWGLIILTVLLLATAVWLMRKRRVRPTPA
ncbi:MAG: IPTL-CTERM sorting domain-containing protein, partial [candidate division Zixibacteria bacterium]|nr:IPTL-CTERM sorting domain-containing protein [candidate division Zixibacteria bacterium]